MAFDCVCIDFRNSQRNLEKIKEIFPYAEVIPFVSNYHDVIKQELKNCRTQYLWVLSTLCDYNNFDFDFIPEQFQQTQLHTWAVEGQKEGDTFLVPKQFLEQDIKFLRDYQEVNYHTTDLDYDYNYDVKQYDLSNNFDLEQERRPLGTYFQYSETKEKQKFYISHWEDQKIYVKGTTYFIPYSALPVIKEQVYDYPNIFVEQENQVTDRFDIFYVSNGEPFEEENYKALCDHAKKHDLANKVGWIRNVPGRSEAYKKAALESSTEYFYAVFAKSIPVDTFLFDYTVDRGKNKRHYIFYARLEELDLEYGTFNVDLYNKTLCLRTEGHFLDFTLSQKHEVVPVISNTVLLSPDNYTAWKNGFREVSKLVYWNMKKPTVETAYRIKKWQKTENKWLSAGATDAVEFLKEIEYSHDKLLQTYNWDFCRSRFKQLYPQEIFY